MPERDNIKKTKIEGLLVIERPTFPDERGFFREVFRFNEFKDFSGINFKPVQVNHSLSHPGVLRGIHAEGWNKIIYPVTGSVFIALTDVRPDSETFGKYETFSIDTEREHKAFYVPKGVANSVCVTGERDVHYLYIVDAYYDGEDTTAVAWDDPDLKIPWPVKNPVISERDKNNPKLRDLFPDKFK